MGKIKLRGKLENVYPEPVVEPKVEIGGNPWEGLNVRLTRYRPEPITQGPTTVRPMAAPVGLAYAMRMNYRDEDMSAVERDVEAFYGTRIENNSSNGVQPRMHVSGVTFLNEGSGVTVEDVR